MSFSGALRSINAAANRMEREARRRQREFEKQQKKIAKLEAIEQVEYEVEEYENYIKLIQSLHLDCGKFYNWEEIANKKCPSKPCNENIDRNAAQEKLDNYKPSFFDKRFKRIDKKIEKLKKNIETGIQNDELEHKKALLEFDKKLN